MGYITSYYGDIHLYDENAIKIITKLLKDEEVPFDGIDDDIEIDENLLRINGHWKDYDDLMLKICVFIASIDKSSEGVIDCKGEEKNDLWRITIENGKVLKVLGKVTYNYDSQEEFDDIKTKKQVYDVTKNKELLKELMIENLK